MRREWSPECFHHTSTDLSEFFACSALVLERGADPLFRDCCCKLQVRKYVDAWSPPVSPLDSKDAQLRILAENLYQRRPVLYLQGHTQPYPAQVLLRTVRKPSVGALTKAATAAGLFQSPSNTFIVIKFDPQFGYAGEAVITRGNVFKPGCSLVACSQLAGWWLLLAGVQQFGLQLLIRAARSRVVLQSGRP